MIRKFVTYMLAALLWISGAQAAVEVAGVKFEDRTKVGTTDLVLNGAGLRTRLFVKVYAMGLYVPEKKTSAEGVLGLKGPKRIHIATLRDLTAEQFADALVEGIQKNTPEAELASLKASIDEFRAMLLDLKAAPKGANIYLEFSPEAGTRLVFNAEMRGKAIPGDAFYRALLRIWLGDKPAQDDLKEALLGKSGS